MTMGEAPEASTSNSLVAAIAAVMSVRLRAIEFSSPSVSTTVISRSRRTESISPRPGRS